MVRSSIRATVGLLIAVVLATLALAWVSWSLSSHFAPVQRFLAASAGVHQAILELEAEMQNGRTRDMGPYPRKRLADLLDRIEELKKHREQLHFTAETDSLFFIADWKLSLAEGNGAITRPMLEDGLLFLRRGLREENERREAVLADLEQRIMLLHYGSLSAAGILVVFLGIVIWILDVRLYRPLRRLGQFMQRIQRREYASFAESEFDPVLDPVVREYNAMVTKLANHEEMQTKQQSALKQEVQQASSALIQQQISLSRAQQQVAAAVLTASIAHEIRNPMSGITMALRGLRDELSSEDQISRIDMVVDELHRVNRLISTLIDRSRVPPEPISALPLRHVVEALIQLASYQIPTTLQISTDIPADLNCLFPEAAFRQALLNLLLNASQAVGEKAGHILVKAWLDSERLHISVEDNGPGFPESVLKRGIQPYDSQREGGTGLGLATVRRFVQNHDGTLQIENRPEGGARVTLSFPNKRCTE